MIEQKMFTIMLTIQSDVIISIKMKCHASAKKNCVYCVQLHRKSVDEDEVNTAFNSDKSRNSRSK